MSRDQTPPRSPLPSPCTDAPRDRGNRACEADSSAVRYPDPSSTTRSPAQAAAYTLLEHYAPLPYNVLIRGETGTGKELAARYVHRLSPRHDEPFVAINCAAISESLAESELFGHRRGSFTGAHRDHAGAFERAGAGTLFLDEVAELPLALQAKLLRVLEDRRFTPVGGEQELPVRARIVAATHRDLAAMVREGTLREDFLHRLFVLDVHLPPLRRRLEDLESLIDTFLADVRRDTGRSVCVDPSALEASRAYAWPGNIRELRHTIVRAAALADQRIRAEDLGLGPTRVASPSDGDGVSIPRGSYNTMRRAMLLAVVEEEGSVRQAARRLKVPRSTLGDWLKRRPPASDDN